MRRVKQVTIDTLADGKPWALRVHSVRSIPDPDGGAIELPDVVEIPYAELPKAAQAQVRALLKSAAATLDTLAARRPA